MKRILIWSLRIAALTLCIGYALWDVDFPLLGAALARYDPGKLAFLAVLTFVPYVALAGRLVTLLRGIAGEPTLRTTLVASLFALGMNNLLPARLGEVAKVAYLRQHCGASTGYLMGAVFWERFADVHALLLLSLVTLVALGRTEAFVPVAASVALGWGMLTWLRHRPRLFEALVNRLPGLALPRLGHDAMGFLRRGMGGRTSAELTFWTFATWLFYALHVYLVLVWVAQIDVTPVQALTVFLGISLGVAIPVSPGALGVYEAIVVLVLGWYGVAPETALAAALTAHMLQYIPTTLIAAVVLARTNVALGKARMPRAAGTER